MSLLYFQILTIQGSIVPILWVVFWKKIRPHLRFFAWSLPLALIIGFGWDSLMGVWQVWEWINTSGPFIGVLPVEDMLFIVEIYLIPSTLALIFRDVSLLHRGQPDVVSRRPVPDAVAKD